MRRSTKKLYSKFLQVYFFLLPLNAVSLGSMGSALKLLAIAPIAIALLNIKPFKIGRPVILQGVYSLFVIFSVFWSISTDRTLGIGTTICLLFILLFSGTYYEFSKSDIVKFKQALVWSSRLMAAVVIAFADYIEGRLWLKNDIINEDPNYMCAYFLFGVLAALEILAGNEVQITRKLLAVAELCVYLSLILISGSRGGLLAVVIPSIIFVFLSGEKTFKGVVKKVAIFAVGLACVNVILLLLPESLSDRFTIESILETGGSGRVILWQQAWKVFISADWLRKIFGYGAGTVQTLFSQYDFEKVNVVHNMFLETLVELGIVGFLLYTSAIIAFLVLAVKNRDKFAFFVMLGMIIMSLSTSIQAFKPYFNVWLFTVLVQNVNRDKQNNT